MDIQIGNISDLPTSEFEYPSKAHAPFVHQFPEHIACDDQILKPLPAACGPASSLSGDDPYLGKGCRTEAA